MSSSMNGAGPSGAATSSAARESATDATGGMTKSGLIQAVADRFSHLPARDIEIVVNTIFDAMTDALRIGDRIEIRGFGSFSVRHRRSRTGRNPKTGHSIAVPEKRVPFFTVGHELRQRVNNGRPGTDGGAG